MDAVSESRRNAVRKRQIQPAERTEAGRDARTRLARPNSQARTRTGIFSPSCSADHEQKWKVYVVDPYSAENANYT